MKINNKIICRKIISVCSILTLLLVSASAASSSSAWKRFGSAIGSVPITYKHNATVNVANGKAWANATMITDTGTTKVPTGYVGAQAVLLRNNKAVLSTAMIYNSTEATGITVTSNSSTISGDYQAKGYCSYWQKDFYVEGEEMCSYISPILQLGVNSKSNKNIPDEFKCHINTKGETYGKLAAEEISGQTLDLIEAVGINGKTGYIRADDLRPKFSSPQEAAQYNPEEHTIPVYDKNGTVVIDSFPIVDAAVEILE